MKKMESGGTMRFLDWMKEKQVYIVAGSDKEKVHKQLPASIVTRVKVFSVHQQTNCGKVDKPIYKNDWKPTPILNLSI